MSPFSTTILTLFGFCVLFTLYCLSRSISKPLIAIGLAIMVCMVQSWLSISGFYLNEEAFPPRFIFLILPSLLIILSYWLITKNSDLVPIRLDALVLLNCVRIPVEICLFLLYQDKMIPELMTFEGRNWDILSGISAPLIWYWGYYKKTISKTWLLVWNVLCVGLLFNIVINAILAAPTPFQMQAFDQPNRAVLYFPLVLLPALIVPLVLVSHLVLLSHLLKKSTSPVS